MSDRQTDGPDVVEEALARAELPLTYRGDVGDEEVRVLGYVGNDGPTLEAQAVWYDDPDGNAVPEERYAVPVGTAVELLDVLAEFVESYTLEAEDRGEDA